MFTAVGLVPKIVCQRTAVPPSRHAREAGEGTGSGRRASGNGFNYLKLKPTSPEDKKSWSTSDSSAFRLLLRAQLILLARVVEGVVPCFCDTSAPVRENVAKQSGGTSFSLRCTV